jgi:hypothetical protein
VERHVYKNPTKRVGVVQRWSHRNVTCSHYDRDEKLCNWFKTTLAQSNINHGNLGLLTQKQIGFSSNKTAKWNVMQKKWKMFGQQKNVSRDTEIQYRHHVMSN